MAEPHWESSSKAIGFIDRSECAGCVDVKRPLRECCMPFVDLSSEAVICEDYRPATPKEA